MKALIGVFVLFTCSMAQYRLRPFKIGIISSLEHREMLSTLLTLYGGLIFVQGYQLSGLSIAFFVVIVMVNARFWILWVYCLVTVYKSKFWIDAFRRWMKKTFWIRVSLEDENFLWYKSKSQSTNQEISIKEIKSKFTTDNKQKEHTNMKMISKNESHATYGSCYRNDQNEESNLSARTPKRLLIKGKNKTYGRIDSKNIGKFSVQTQFKRRKQKKKKQVSITDKVLIEESKEDRSDLNIFKRSNNQTDYPKRKKNLLGETKANKTSMELVQDLKDDINEEESKRELMKLDQDEVEHHYIFENFSLKRVE